jgi:uncharacterized membrane protein
MNHIVFDFVNLFAVGLLAGEELVICYGVRGAINTLDEESHIRLRQALIRRLRILVPAILVPTILTGFVALLLDRDDSGFGFRCAGAFALVAFILITLFGTVPINEGALDWQPDAPPSDWRAIVNRWEKLDVARCWAAIAAFVCFTVAVALKVSNPLG